MTTHLPPITDYWTGIQATTTEALESYLLFKADSGELDKATNQDRPAVPVASIIRDRYIRSITSGEPGTLDS